MKFKINTPVIVNTCDGDFKGKIRKITKENDEITYYVSGNNIITHTNFVRRDKGQALSKLPIKRKGCIDCCFGPCKFQ